MARRMAPADPPTHKASFSNTGQPLLIARLWYLQPRKDALRTHLNAPAFRRQVQNTQKAARIGHFRPVQPQKVLTLPWESGSAPPSYIVPSLTPAADLIWGGQCREFSFHRRRTG